MARIRSIHPDFPSDKKLAQVPRDARLTYVECWCIADDKGLFRAERRQLLGQLYPYDTDVDEVQLEAWLSALVKIGVLRWGATRDGMRVGELVNFPKRQKIDRPSISFLYGELAPLDEGQQTPSEPPAAPSREGSETLGVGSLEPGALSPEPTVLSPESRGPTATLASVPRYAELHQRLPDKAHPAIDGYLRSARHPQAVVASILDEGPDTGINGAAGKTWAMIGQALCDMQAAGEPFKPVLLRAFIARLMREAATPGNPAALSRGDAARARAAELEREEAK